MSVIGFDFLPSLACLTIEGMALNWIHSMDKEHDFFRQLSSVNGFDYYFINDILIIPDPLPVARERWNRKLGINNLIIEFRGSFIVFFSFNEVKKDFLLAGSLSLPQFEFLKSSIRWV